MNRSDGLRNKLVYVSILIAMLLPLFLLGQPDSGRQERSGGQLTRMRDRFQIAESHLGDIDPASETMKLASLGMRGVAATLLWQKAHKYKVRHQWDRLRASLNNIALLQPHYEKIWEHQAHNMAYNVSVEFDDYRQRYAWVKSGTEYLSEGVRRNRRAPRLIWYTGWFYGQKIGVADEKRQFRRLFRKDIPFHQRIEAEGIDIQSREAKGPDQLPDNWLVGRLWLNYGYELTRKGGIPIKRQTPLNFYETGPKWRIRHAIAVEREWDAEAIDNIDQALRRAWVYADDDWTELGAADIPTTSEFTIRLGFLDEMQQRHRELSKKFDTLTENIREKLRNKRIANLTDPQREAFELDPESRNREQHALAFEARRLVTPSMTEITQAISPEKKLAAIRLSGQINELERRIRKTDGYRNQLNYPYWASRCKAEQDTQMILARRLVHEAEIANEEAELDQAIELYEKAWIEWAKVFDSYPLLMVDSASDDLPDYLERYRRAIDQEHFPDDFPLAKFVEMRQRDKLGPKEYERLQNEKRKANEAGKEKLKLNFGEITQETLEKFSDQDTEVNKKETENKTTNSDVP